MRASREVIARSIFLFCTLASAVIVSAILVFMIVLGLPLFKESAFFSVWTGPWIPHQGLYGIHPMISGTLWIALLATALCLVILSTALALPAGVCSGVYLAEYAGPGMKKWLGILFDILAGVPSIVIGLFGFSLAVFLHNHFSDRVGPCLLISALSLAVLVLPYIVRGTQRSLEELPTDIRKTALALGATKLQNIIHVLIPNALSGISSGMILAIGRCAEDTAVISEGPHGKKRAGSVRRPETATMHCPRPGIGSGSAVMR